MLVFGHFFPKRGNFQIRCIDNSITNPWSNLVFVNSRKENFSMLKSHHDQLFDHVDQVKIFV